MRYLPHPYQTQAEQWILDHEGCGLFLDCGLGKTVITLSAVESLLSKGEISKVLVIAPLRVAQNVWAEECAKWDHLQHLRCAKAVGEAKERVAALDSDADIYIINRENIGWLSDYLTWRKKKWPWDMVVLDELSSFKSATSKRFGILKRYRALWKRVVGLTGTPMPNSQIDLWSEIYLLDGGERLGPFISKYRSAYFKEYRHQTWTDWIIKPEGATAITRKISDIVMSMRSIDYLKVPPVRYIDRVVQMSADEQAVYDRMKHDSVAQIMAESGAVTVSALSAGVLAGKLLQLANGAIYDEDHRSVRVHDAKLEELDDLIEAAQGKPVLVFYAFRHDLHRIKNRYPEARELITPADVKDWNAGKISLLVAHPASMGHGLNLQDGGNVIVWFGLPWSLELYQQANARLHRQGQKNLVSIYHIICKGSIDERVMKVLSGKSKQQDELMEAVKAEVLAYAS